MNNTVKHTQAQHNEAARTLIQGQFSQLASLLVITFSQPNALHQLQTLNTLNTFSAAFYTCAKEHCARAPSSFFRFETLFNNELNFNTDVLDPNVLNQQTVLLAQCITQQRQLDENAFNWIWSHSFITLFQLIYHKTLEPNTDRHRQSLQFMCSHLKSYLLAYRMATLSPTAFRKSIHEHPFETMPTESLDKLKTRFHRQITIEKEIDWLLHTNAISDLPSFFNHLSNHSQLQRGIIPNLHGDLKDQVLVQMMPIQHPNGLSRLKQCQTVLKQYVPQYGQTFIRTQQSNAQLHNRSKHSTTHQDPPYRRPIWMQQFPLLTLYFSIICLSPDIHPMFWIIPTALVLIQVGHYLQAQIMRIPIAQNRVAQCDLPQPQTDQPRPTLAEQYGPFKSLTTVLMLMYQGVRHSARRLTTNHVLPESYPCPHQTACPILSDEFVSTHLNLPQGQNQTTALGTLYHHLTHPETQPENPTQHLPRS